MARHRAKNSPTTFFLDCLRRCLGLRPLYKGPHSDEYGCRRHLLGQHFDDGNRQIVAIPPFDERAVKMTHRSEKHDRVRLDFREPWSDSKPSGHSLRKLVYGRKKNPKEPP